jgi:hypothetical protein
MDEREWKMASRAELTIERGMNVPNENYCKLALGGIWMFGG